MGGYEGRTVIFIDGPGVMSKTGEVFSMTLRNADNVLSRVDEDEGGIRMFPTVCVRRGEETGQGHA